MTERLGNPHKAALFALMAAAREVSNTELADLAGFRIHRELREPLNKAGLVTSRTDHAPHTHKLTDKGWAWCAKELTNHRPPNAGSLGGAFYAVLSALDRFLRKETRSLAEVFAAPSELGPEDVEAQIRLAYRKLTAKPRDWVRLVELRPLLNGASKAEVDSVLKQMSRAGEIQLAPDSNRKALTAVDHAAAIRVGGEDKHLMAIEVS